MIKKDDRTSRQRHTHSVLVAGTDTFMSGWGEAKGGVSVAAWACKPENRYQVERWVRSRSEMKRVRIVGKDYLPQCKHFHVYVVEEGHPALN